MYARPESTVPTPERRRQAVGWLVVVATAALYTLLSVVKPLHVDDAAYYYYAAQIARHPGDPFGFDILWYQDPEPAIQVLAPPALPYWWAAAIRLFGQHPFLWKLWLFPFPLLLAAAVGALARRLVGGLDSFLVLLTLFSPAFLPSLNLMLDVPALALGLAAIAVFLRACERLSPGLALLAGLLAGVGMQTKYTAGLQLATLLLYGVMNRRCTLSAVAGMAACLVFAAWEVFVASRYGESHFLHHLHGTAPPREKLVLAYPLVTIAGALGAAALTVGWVGLGVPGKKVLIAGVGVALAYALIVVVPTRFGTFPPFLPQMEWYDVADVVFLMAGVGFWGTVGWVVCHLWRTTGTTGLLSPRPESFLIVWLLVETAGYFALTPFPAARRFLALAVVTSFLSARLLVMSGRARSAGRALRLILAGNAALATGYYLLDLREAWAQERIATRAAAATRADPGPVWYVGHWGFQFYAEQAGMRPVAPGQSRLRASDWLVVPEERIGQQTVVLEPGTVDLVETIWLDDGVPLQTLPAFYGGRTPLVRAEGPRALVRLFRVRRDIVPKGPAVP